MSANLELQLFNLLKIQLFPGLIGPQAGLHVRQGIGTYQQFLKNAEVGPPYSRPPQPKSAGWDRFERACREMARRIVNRVTSDDGLVFQTVEALVFEPGKLYRAGGPESDRWGGWWFDQSVYEKAVAEASTIGGQRVSGSTFTGNLRKVLRDHLAIKYEWNTLESLFVMNVLSGSFPVVVGKGVAKEHLRGGVEQIWLPWSPIVGVARIELTGISVLR